MSARICIVCGARVRNENPLTKTCQPLCTRARKLGISYEEALALEAQEGGQIEEREMEEIKGMPVGMHATRTWYKKRKTHECL